MEVQEASVSDLLTVAAFFSGAAAAGWLTRVAAARVLVWWAARGAVAAPVIAAGSNRDMLGQAIALTKGLAGTAAQKASMFADLAKQVTRLSGNSWTAPMTRAADGAYIFAGEYGHAIVISPAGQMFRANLKNIGTQFQIGAGGALKPIYDALTSL